MTNIVNSIVEEDNKISAKDVEAVHRLHSKRSPAPTIVRLKRNVIDNIRRNKKKLVGVDRNCDLPAGTKIFVNHNLSPSMKIIESNARKLKREGKILDVWFTNASVRIKKLDGSVVKVDHEFNLCEYFPDYHGFTFNTDF